MNYKTRVVSGIQYAVHRVLARFKYGLTNYRHADRSSILQFVLQVSREREMVTTPLEAYQLYVAARSTAHLPGAAAEVGVYKGATARVIQQALPKKTLHLFDTFEGLPDTQDALKKGDYRGSLEEVKEYFRANGHGSVQYHKGYFPTETGPEVASERFCFVNLDMDYYDGTLAALKFLWPRMVTGGIVMTHDYVGVPAPTRAFNEFFADRLTPVVELSGLQAMAVKTEAS